MVATHSAMQKWRPSGALCRPTNKLDCLEQSIVYLARLMGNTNKDRKERNLLGDLPRGWPNPKPIREDPPREPVVHVKGVGGDKFDGARRVLTFQDRPL